MADAKKCDRCGKLYVRGDFNTKTINKMWLRRCPEWRCEQTAQYDLCLDCGEELDKWLDNESAPNERKEERL